MARESRFCFEDDLGMSWQDVIPLEALGCIIGGWYILVAYWLI